jgi:hypothetical protein
MSCLKGFYRVSTVSEIKREQNKIENYKQTMETSRKLAIKIEGEGTTFKASKGWYDKLKKQRGIR